MRKRETAEERDERVIARHGAKWSVVALRESAVAWSNDARAIVRILNRIARKRRGGKP